MQNLSIIPSDLLLSLDLVKLGRFVTNIEQPHESYHEPAISARIRAIRTPFTFAGQNERVGKSSFAAAIASLLSARISKQVNSKIRVAPATGSSYSLDNSDEWFDLATATSETREWMEGRARRDKDIYMIVGFKTLVDARIVLGSAHGHEVQGQATIPISLALSAIAPVLPSAGVIDPAVHAEHGSLAGGEKYYIAPGEQVCAVQYRKVDYKLFSSRAIDQAWLSKTRHWSCIEGELRSGKDDKEDDVDNENSIGVHLEDTFKVDGKWEIETASGETICLRNQE